MWRVGRWSDPWILDWRIGVQLCYNLKMAAARNISDGLIVLVS